MTPWRSICWALLTFAEYGVLLQDEMDDLSRSVHSRSKSLGAYYYLSLYYHSYLRAAGVSLV